MDYQRRGEGERGKGGGGGCLQKAAAGAAHLVAMQCSMYTPQDALSNLYLISLLWTTKDWREVWPSLQGMQPLALPTWLQCNIDP